MFASRHEILHDPPWYVFSKRMVAGKARWEYCGSYETTNVGNIDAEEFKGFPRNVCGVNQSVCRVLMYDRCRHGGAD